jgi:hypothetical protein
MRHILDQLTLEDLLLTDGNLVERLQERLRLEPQSGQVPLLNLVPLVRG